VDDGIHFFLSEKFDRGAIAALTGKGLELPVSKSPHLLDGKQYDQIVSLRNNDRNRHYRECTQHAAAQIGVPEKSGSRPRRTGSENFKKINVIRTCCPTILIKNPYVLLTSVIKLLQDTNALPAHMRPVHTTWVTAARTICRLLHPSSKLLHLMVSYPGRHAFSVPATRRQIDILGFSAGSYTWLALHEVL